MSWLSDLLGGLGRDLYDEIPTEIKSLYTTPLTQITAPDITFQPFTVTGPSGSQVTTTAGGGTTYTLSPQQQAMQQQLFGGAGDFFTQAAQPTAQRETDIYKRMLAAQLPEQQRQRTALEERLFSQGRGGVTTSQYGGTPEQLAMAKAQAEAQNTAMLSAMQQAQAEQAQQASLGGQFLQQSYAPQSALLSAMSPALNVAGMADVARRQQGEYNLETALANLSGQVGQQAALGSLYSSMFGGAGGLLSGLMGAGTDIFDVLFG